MLPEYFVRRVAEFHAKHDAPIGAVAVNAKDWGQDVLHLRKSLVYEEAGEIMLALHDKDELELIDGFGDLLYVAAGMWVAVIGIKEFPGSIRTEYVKPNLWSGDFNKTVHRHVDGAVNFTAGIENSGHYHKVIHHAMLGLVELGYNPVEIFDEIHASNMTKTPTKGDIRVRDKGPDYRAPDLTPFLRRS